MSNCPNNILFDRPTPIVAEDYTDTFIQLLRNKGIHTIQVEPTFIIERLNDSNTSAGSITTNTTEDIEFVVNQLEEVNPTVVLVREVRKETIGYKVRYIVRIDYIKVS